MRLGRLWAVWCDGPAGADIEDNQQCHKVDDLGGGAGELRRHRPATRSPIQDNALLDEGSECDRREDQAHKLTVDESRHVSRLRASNTDECRLRRRRTPETKSEEIAVSGLRGCEGCHYGHLRCREWILRVRGVGVAPVAAGWPLASPCQDSKTHCSEGR